MKNYFLLLLMVFFLLPSRGQDTEKVRFGSNLENGKFVTVNGNQIYYETYGQGTPLLLIHGGLGSIINFENSISGLSKRFKVIALDSPGHGRSSHVDSLSYPLLAGNISQFIDKLELDSLYIMGWSDGGIIGLILAADRPDKIKKLIAIGANTRVDGLSQEDIEWIENEMIDWAKNEEGWWLINHLPLITQPSKIDIYLENTKKMWLTDIYVEDAKIRSIKVPTMIMQGDKDGIRKGHAIELNEAIVNSQLCILPNTPHYVFGSKADLVNRISIDFFSEK